MEHVKMIRLGQMVSRIKLLMIALATAFVVALGVLVPSASAANKPCSSGLLTFPAWYSNVSEDCKSVNITKLNDLWVIALNFVEMLLQVVAYAAIGYLVWGGFKYIKSRGDPGSIQQAQDAITNAIVGLGVSLGSVAIVNFISSNIAGTVNQRFGLPKVDAGALQLSSVMNNIVFPIAGAVAVLFIIIGAYKYVTSNGDAGETKKARYTIIYSVVGLVIIIMSFAIVQLILGRFQ